MLLKPNAPWRDLYPFDSNFLDLDGLKYHYLDEHASKDQAPVLLFVHGNPTWSFHWRRFIGALSNEYRCIAPDHIGCGASDLQKRPLSLADHIENLVRLVTQLDLKDITLVAQDWGGAIGLGALQRLQDRFERIALFNTGAFPPWFIPWRIRVCRWPGIGKLAVQGGNLFSLAALKMTLNRSAQLPSEVAQAYLAPHESWKHRAAVYQFVKDIPLSESHPTWQTLAEIERGLPALANMPIQLIWGMRDWCFTPECLEKFMGYWPNAEVHQLEDVGHWVVEDAPDESLDLLRNWLDRTSQNADEVISS